MTVIHATQTRYPEVSAFPGKSNEHWGQKTLVSLPRHMGGRGDFCFVCWQNAQSLGYQSILFSNC